MTDLQLLQDYAANNSQNSFNELVRRYVDLIYSSAVRQTRDRHLADDVTQAVFLLLSQKAKKLAPRTTLAAWLFQTTRYAAANAMRLRDIRRRRENEAAKMIPTQSEPAAENSDLLPLLDQAVNRLGATDRQVVLMHYFQGAPVSQISEV